MAQSSLVEVDAREVPWHVVRRLALEAGVFPPVYQPISEEELARIWPDRYGQGTRGLSRQTCQCRKNPATFRLQGRVLFGYQELGDVLPGEAGLGWAPGWNASFEPRFDVSAGRWWAAVSPRLQGRLSDGGQQLDPEHALAWPGWGFPTGNYQVGRARTRSNDWILDLPRLVVGCRLDGWNLSAGWMPAKTGPGISGALTLDRTGLSIPAVVLRRNHSFTWSGILKPFAPDNLLLRAGRLTTREVRYKDEWGAQSRQADPWFFQWLVGWEVTSWFRTTFTHTAMATAWEGTLWPDLLQINFPVIGTTWRESDSGPITDRIFSAQFEFRWRKAPWPVLPSTAGRLYWDYAGTDFLPSGPGGVIPELSIPASVVGVEFFDPGWDLGFEYLDLFHPEALWYSNGGYPEGYTQDQWLLGHHAGGGARGVIGQVRVRPSGWPLEIGLKAGHTFWKHERFFPGEGLRSSLALSLGRDPMAGDEHLHWQGVLEWVREEHRGSDDPTVQKDWLRVLGKLGY